MNHEKNLPGCDFARMTGYGAADFDFNAVGAAMDCNREFYQAHSIYSDGPGIIASPGNIPRTGNYIIGTIQSLAVF